MTMKDLPRGISELADILRIEATPLEERPLPASTYAALREVAAARPGQTALSFFPVLAALDRPETWSWGALLAEITRTANMLRAEGIGRDDVVAYLLPNLPQTHWTIWGGETAGIVMALNPALGAEELGALLAAAGAKMLVAAGPGIDPEIWDKATRAAGASGCVRQVLVVGSGAAPEAVGAIPVRDFDRLRAAHPAEALTFEPPGPDDISSYFCTGGTTGLPKIARRSQRSEIFDAWAIAAAHPRLLHPGTVAFCGLPLFHVNAQLVTGLAVWMQGGAVVLGGAAGYRTPGLLARFWEVVERFRVTLFSSVPTILSALLATPVEGHDLSSLEYAVCGAAPMPAALFGTFEAATGLNILEGYGLTEGACVSSLNPANGAPRIGSIGMRLPYQRMRAAELDAEGRFRRWCATDEAGSLLLDGPNVFAGYVDPGQSAAAWVEVEGRRWFNTGDLGREDGDGFFWLTGRRKELIIRGGHNIDPATIENPIHHHPQVALAAAVGRPDAHAGEVPVLYVQPRPGATLSVAEIAAWAEAEIGERAARPKAIHVIEAMPVTAVGKIFKPALVMREIESVLRDTAADAAIPLAAVRVEQDPARGMVAHVTLAQGDAAALREALQPFTFKLEIAAG
ncbi:acyl-CoA synthetase [Paenirhodobacter hankyongi]|uniref:acyl-CoA synthetase n=1 Tax=Paenirhodobacter hankyongi TaxID=2294033 RepID=UPI001C7D2EA3|nr:acyl-CoA synthetase [Sinirhodobacter hankyongi]